MCGWLLCAQHIFVQKQKHSQILIYMFLAATTKHRLQTKLIKSATDCMKFIPIQQKRKTKLAFELESQRNMLFVIEYCVLIV